MRECCCNFSVGVALKVWFSHAQYMKMTRDEHVLGSCNISIYWRIWMLLFLLQQIWMGIDYFLLNFFATSASVLGLHITVTFGSVLGLQVNSGFQRGTRCEPFVASTMLRGPEPTKKRAEQTILGIIAIEIRHLTRFALLAYCCYEWNVVNVCGVIMSPHGLRLITVTGIWI